MSDSWIVGINPVEGALANDIERVRELRVEKGSRNPRVAELAALAREHRIAVQQASRGELDRLSGKARHQGVAARYEVPQDRKSTRLNSSHVAISYAVFCL